MRKQKKRNSFIMLIHKQDLQELLLGKLQMMQKKACSCLLAKCILTVKILKEMNFGADG